jgi:hypothetical protein
VNVPRETHRIEQTTILLTRKKEMKTWNFQNGNSPFGENGKGNLPGKNQLGGLGVKRVGKADSRVFVIHFHHILYFFKGSAAERGMVNIPKFPPAVFRPNRIYLRTSKSVFLASHRSLETLGQILDSSLFQKSHQKFLVNLQRVGWLETRDKTGSVAVIPDDGIPEQIPITRQYKPKILAAFHVPQRRRPKKNKTDKEANSNRHSRMVKILV